MGWSFRDVLELWKLSSIEIIELLKLLKNMQILNSNMVCVSVRVRWWECKSDGEDKSEVEHESAGFGEGVDRTEGGCKCVHISYSCGSEGCHVGRHEAIPLCLVCTYENRIITLLFPRSLIISIIQWFQYLIIFKTQARLLKMIKKTWK